MPESLSFISLLLVVFLAFLVPLALTRFPRLRLPVVVGEIVAGILVGRSGFGLVHEDDPMLELLAELGFVFLMFLSGIEIDFSSLGLSGARARHTEQRAWGPLPLGGLSLLLTLLLATGVGISLHQLGLVQNPWMMALILSTTSLGVVMPILKESNLISSRFGQTLLIAAMLADFVTMLLITVVVALLSGGLTIDILLIGILFLVFLGMYHFSIFTFNSIPGLRRTLDELSHASTQIKVRAAFMVMLIFVALSEVLGTEIILGAFLAGAMLSLLRTPADMQLAHKLEAIGFGFFIPIFFIMVGVRFNLAALAGSTQALFLVPLLLGAAILVKLLPALLFRLRFSWRETLAAGSLLSARLSLIIAASAIGLRLGVIGEEVNAAIILVAILTVTFAPLLFTRLAPHTAAQTPPIIIASAGELGMLVAEQLQTHGEAVVLLSPDAEDVVNAQRRDLPAVLAHLDRADPAAEPYLSRARALICTSSDMEYNYRVCQWVRTTYGIEHLVVQVNDPQQQLRFTELGAVTFNPALDRVALLTLLARNPGIYELLVRNDDDKEVAEVAVHNTDYTSRKLLELKLPGDLLILAVRRRDELLVPHGHTQLKVGDRLTLIGSLEAISQARQTIAATTAS